MGEIVICALAKKEHKYINEWVKYHLGIGFDKIYLFDNDDKKSEWIGNYIDSLDKVDVIDIRGKKEKCMHQKVFNKFYQEYNDTFDWCLFIDIDEYLVGTNDIHTYINNNKDIYRGYGQVRIKWKLFNDNELIERDMSKTLMEVFTNEVHSSLNRNLKDKGNLEKQGKALIRGGQELEIRSPHFANCINSCLPNGKECHSGVVIEEDYSGCDLFLNHYMTKSLSEFVEQKFLRNDAVYNYNIGMNYYWRINKKTNEKVRYLAKRGIFVI